MGTTPHPRRTKRWLTAALTAALGAGAIATLSAAPAASAAPPPGSTPWAVLMCKAAGNSAEPVAPSTVQTLFTTHDATNPTMWDYWWQVSNSTINLLYSQVAPKWVETNRTLAQLHGESRSQKLQDCADAAGWQITNPDSTYGIIALWNVDFGGPGDSGATATGQSTQTLAGTTRPYAGVVVEPWALFPSFLEHEMGHGYGLDHTFGSVQCGAIAQSGEYCDPYSTMGVSWNGEEFQQPVWRAPDGPSANASAGPGLDAFDLEKLGFIPAGREAVVTPTTGSQTAVTLTSLSAPNPARTLTARITTGSDPNSYVTVEFRRRLNWDRGIDADGIVIHGISDQPVAGHGSPLSYLVERSSSWADGVWRAGESTTVQGVTITVQSVDLSSNTATVVIAGPAAPPPPTGGGGGGGDGGLPGCSYNCGHHGPIHLM